MTTAPHAPVALHQRVHAGGHVAVSFVKLGIYLLYDNKTTRFDDKVGQIVARKASSGFPRPAYAIVVATDAQGGGLKPTTSDVAIPDSTMTFTPWTIVVPAGETIKFDNHDGETHEAMSAHEPMLMPASASSKQKSGLRLEKMNAFGPITLPGNGGKGTLTLKQPGEHHYYCPLHAVYDSSAHTFAPRHSYGGYPFIMDGVIVVLPS